MIISTNKRKVKSFLILVLAFLIMTIPFYGCKSSIGNFNIEQAAVGEYPVTVNNLEFATQPQKILVISPSLADVVIALGCEQFLTAASVECTHRELEILPKVSVSDKEAIADTGADLILAEPLDDETRQSLSALGIPIFEVPLASSRDAFEKMYAQIATALMGDGYGYDTGREVARDIFITLDTITRVTSKDTITTACYLYDIQNKAITKDSFGSLMLEYAGLTNIFVHGNNSEYNIETLKTANPDVIFCDIGVKEQIMSSSDFSNVKAVKDGKVFELDRSYVEWLGRRVVSGTTEIASLAFPELLEEVDPKAADRTSKIESAVKDELSELNSNSGTETDKNSYKSQEYGDSGDDVLSIQKRLSELGYLTAEYDGEYGSYTEEAVKAFQKDNGLTETGISDEETQKKLFSTNVDAKAKNSASSDSSESE